MAEAPPVVRRGLEAGRLIRVRIIHGQLADDVSGVARVAGDRIPLRRLRFTGFRVGYRVFVQAGDVYSLAVFNGSKPDGDAAVRLAGGIFPYRA